MASVEEKMSQSTEQARAQLTSFLTDLQQLFNRATKPTQKKYIESVKVILLGVLIMGFVGFMVKIASLPINTILLGGSK